MKQRTLYVVRLQSRGPFRKATKAYVPAKSQKKAEKRAREITSRLSGGLWDVIESWAEEGR